MIKKVYLQKFLNIYMKILKDSTKQFYTFMISLKLKEQRNESCHTATVNYTKSFLFNTIYYSFTTFPDKSGFIQKSKLEPIY